MPRPYPTITVDGKVYKHIVGTDRDDILYGTHYDDYIGGGEGDDKLYGSGGDNVLTGGAGKDEFNLDSSGHATITDYESGKDKILVLEEGEIRVEYDGNDTRIFLVRPGEPDNEIACVQGHHISAEEISRSDTPVKAQSDISFVSGGSHFEYIMEIWSGEWSTPDKTEVTPCETTGDILPEVVDFSNAYEIEGAFFLL